MKMPTSTKVLLGLLTLTIGAVPASANIDLGTLNTQVQQQQSTLANHEARITNNEKDIKTLQDNTNTPPASDPVVVPTVTPVVISPPATTDVSTAPTQPTTATPVPASTKTIVSVSNEAAPGATTITIGTEQIFWCKYTYNDGSVSYEQQIYDPKIGPTLQCKAVGDSVPLNP